MNTGIQYVVDVLMGNPINVSFKNTTGVSYVCADDEVDERTARVTKKGIVLNALRAIGAGTVAEVCVQLERTGNPMDISLVYAQLSYLKKAGAVTSKIIVAGNKKIGHWRVTGGE